MPSLSHKDVQDLKRRLAAAEADEYEFAHALLSAQKFKYAETVVLAQMEREGKTLHPHVANRWGGEFAIRLKQYLSGSILDYLSAFEGTVTNAICTKFDYCKRRKDGTLESEEITIGIAVADALLSAATSFPIPVTMVSAYIVKKGILDRWCKCNG